MTTWKHAVPVSLSLPATTEELGQHDMDPKFEVRGSPVPGGVLAWVERQVRDRRGLELDDHRIVRAGSPNRSIAEQSTAADAHVRCALYAGLAIVTEHVIAGRPWFEPRHLCTDLPAACNGIPGCDCVAGAGLCSSVSDRALDFGCI